MAYFHTARLFASLDKKRARSPDASKLVGARLARVLHAQICLLLDTQARQTATRNALVQSQLCLQATKPPSPALLSVVHPVGELPHQSPALDAAVLTDGHK